MTSSDRDAPGNPPSGDSEFVETLAVIAADLDRIERLANDALTGAPLDQGAVEHVSKMSTGVAYDALPLGSMQRKAPEGERAASLDDFLDPAALAQLHEWQAGQRISWQWADVLTVGAAGFLGALTGVYDTQLDAAVLHGLTWLKQTDLVRGWERDAKGMPIDYMGPKFGGAGHRALSAGHDIGRFFHALDQVRTGTFKGTYWQDGQRFTTESKTTPQGSAYEELDWPTAIAGLLKHWVADFVTPMSLPLPGWTLLRDMPDRDLRTFAHCAYVGDYRGSGLNMRSGLLTPSLGLMITEIIVRTQVHLNAYQVNGAIGIGARAEAKLREMLLAAHAAAGAVSLSRTAAAAIAGEAVVAIRHLNVPVIMRVGMLALRVRADASRRESPGVPSWEQLLSEEAATWTLPHAAAIADLLDARTGTGA